uniref:Uncharacterized protein n=2 Tax=Kalanchoe fedtschenkoi TaxID=63787 RepID=A0A7N0VHF3_KALFE
MYKMLQLCLDHLVIFFLSFPFPSFDDHAFRQPHQQSEGLVAGSLNLVTMPLKMITVKCRCGLLSLFIYIFLMTWGTDSGFTMRSLLDFDLNIKSSGSFYVGSYVLQLVVHLSLQMAAHISDIAAAPVGCMKAYHIAGLRSSLILIFARLLCISTIGIFEFVTSTPMTLLVASVAFHVHMSVPDVSQFINLLLAVPLKEMRKLSLA